MGLFLCGMDVEQRESILVLGIRFDKGLQEGAVKRAVGNRVFLVSVQERWDFKNTFNVPLRFQESLSLHG